MTTFLILAAVMTLATVAAIVPAILRKRRNTALDRNRQNIAIARERLAELEAEHAAGKLPANAYAQAKSEFEKSLADDLEAESAASQPGASSGGRWVIAAVAVIVPVMAFGIYMQIGAPQYLDVAGGNAGRVAAHGAADSEMPSVEELVATLEQKLEEEPDQAEGWYLLGRTYMSMQRYEDAVTAFAKVNEMMPDQPAILISLADATAMTQGGRIAGAPAELVAKALVLDPDNLTALWLAGKAEAEAGNNAEAVKYWRRVEALSQDDPATLAEIRSQIAAAEQAGGLSPAAEPEAAEAPPPAPATPETGGVAITVDVALDATLAAQANPGDTVFVFARALEGPPMPLAVARHTVAELPLRVTLTDAMAMMPQMKLSNFPAVRVSARVSRSGDAMTRPGDLVSEDTRVEIASSSSATLVIDRAVP